MTGSRLRHILACAVIALIAACGGSTPTAPAVTTSGVQVITSGNASTSLAPGETRQLVANATQSNGSIVEVTTMATWQSSATNVATVSGTGLLTAVGEGSVDVSATYNGVRGTIHADVKPTCTVSVSPSVAFFTAFGGIATVNVTVNSSSCRWSARSDAAWFPFTFEPSATGSGSFAYSLPPNSTTAARNATIVVETTTAQTATHTIAEDKPLGCSYVTQPEELVFSASGGTGQFNVIATPGDCRWNLVNGLSALGVSITSGFGGTGNGLVRYSVQAHTRAVDADGYIEIAGLSGLNPNGRHHVVILKR